MQENQGLPALTMEGLYFEDLQYHRELDDKREAYEYEMSFNRAIVAHSNTRYTVSLTANVRSKGCESIHLSVTIVGLFLCEVTDEETKQELLKYNTLSIMFPYIRSQISYISTQPDIPPITIPVVNIIQMFKAVDQNGSEATHE